MYIYSSLYVGDYFLFILSASDNNPIKIEFREPNINIKEKKTSKYWNEKIYLYSTILQRKWLDYRFKDKFIPNVKYDNILPLELNYRFLNPTGKSSKIGITSNDKYYRKCTLRLLTIDSKEIFKKELNYLGINKEQYIDINLKVPGLYKIMLTIEDRDYYKSDICFLKEKDLVNLTKSKNNKNSDDIYKDVKMYCSYCNRRVYPMKSETSKNFIYKNYIPFKEYFDIDGLGIDYISNYIKKISYPENYKRGLIHLLNIIRLSSIEDEITIVTNLFKNDPPFAYFITEKLFLFQMIPLMEDRELQRILNKIDDELIASSLYRGETIIIKKIIKNISKRRGNTILNDILSYKTEDNNQNAKDKINKIIKLYFEERYGRVLKIPYNDEIIYDIVELKVTDENIRHSGDIIGIYNNDFYLICLSKRDKICLRYDIESYKDNILYITGITESTIYLKTEISIKYALIHMYNWDNNLEDSKIVENIPKNRVIPLLLYSCKLILTIGAMDNKRIPHEQVIRLKIK